MEKQVQKYKVLVITVTYTPKFPKKIILHISSFRVINFQSDSNVDLHVYSMKAKAKNSTREPRFLMSNELIQIIVNGSRLKNIFQFSGSFLTIFLFCFEIECYIFLRG